MKKEEAIKYLQQLYPNGGHCWLDEQRIEAIGMAVKALQEEPVSTKDKLLALSDCKLHLGWIDDAKVVEFEDCLMQFHEDMNNIPQSTDSLTRLKDTDGVLHSYSKKLMSMAKEEPVSEELEVELKNYLNSDEYINTLCVSGYLLVARHFANWQKQQDQSTIELAEDHAMLAGMNIMEQQMMGKAIDVEVKVDAGGYPYIPQMELYDYDKDVPLAKEGDRYKVVLIKEINMGTSEKQLYKEYQKMLKEMGVKQFTDEEYQKAIKRFKERKEK